MFHAYEFVAGETALMASSSQSITRVGPRLVAKESKHQEMLARSVDFHKDFCRVQEKAAQFAEHFNRRINGPPGFRVGFVKPGVCVCGGGGIRACARACVCVSEAE